MELYTKDLCLRTVNGGDIDEVARMWDFEQGTISAEEAQKAIEYMQKNHKKNKTGYIYHLCLAVLKKHQSSIIGWCGLDGTSARPKILIADEPTTALDVTVQAQITALMKKFQQQYHMSIIYITHDMGVIAEMADTIAVMYLGRIVEWGSALTIFKNPIHPYTRGLLNSMPVLGQKSDKPLNAIEGNVPVPLDPPRIPSFVWRKFVRCPAVWGMRSADHLLKEIQKYVSGEILYIPSRGMLLLLAYSLGLGVPFVLCAVLIDQLKGAFAFIKRHYRSINIVCGVFLILIGILMMTGIFAKFTAALA